MLHGVAINIDISEDYGADEFQQQVDDSIEKTTPASPPGSAQPSHTLGGANAPSVTDPAAASGTSAVSSPSVSPAPGGSGAA